MRELFWIGLPTASSIFAIFLAIFGFRMIQQDRPVATFVCLCFSALFTAMVVLLLGELSGILR